jgi:hypothetical protein
MAARSEARVRGVPGRIWIRLATEASRQLTFLATWLGEPRQNIEERLCEAAAEPTGVVDLDQADLLAYARALRRGDRSVPVGLPEGRFELPVPMEWAAAWATLARDSRLSMDAWITNQLASAPGQALAWEAAAAESGRYLADWALVSASSSMRLSA